MKRASFVLALILPALACDDVSFGGPDDIVLRTDRAQYAAGDTAILRLVNRSGESIGYNLCLHLVQHETDDGWVDTLYANGDGCTLQMYLLRHGDSDTYPAALDREAPAGSYRFRARVYLGGNDEFSVYSSRFEIE